MSKEKLLLVAWVLACIAMAGSLFFSQVMNYPPCALCWYQRILMYPLVIVLLPAVISFDRSVIKYSLPLAIRSAAISRLSRDRPVRGRLRSHPPARRELVRSPEPWGAVIGATLPPGALSEPVLTPPPIDEKSLSRRLMDAFSLLLEGLANEQPTMLFLDDLHWADATTLEVLHFFRMRWAEVPFGLVATVRRPRPGAVDPLTQWVRGEEARPVARLTVEELTELDFSLATIAIVLRDEVDYARDSVRTVLGGRAITKHFDALHGEARNHADVHTVCAVAGRRCEELYERGTMPALAVDEDQRLVGCRAA